jgi:hypothetical protein
LPGVGSTRNTLQVEPLLRCVPQETIAVEMTSNVLQAVHFMQPRRIPCAHQYRACTDPIAGETVSPVVCDGGLGQFLPIKPEAVLFITNDSTFQLLSPTSDECRWMGSSPAAFALRFPTGKS